MNHNELLDELKQIETVLAHQRQADHKEWLFEALHKLHVDVKKCLDDPEKALLNGKRIVREFEDYHSIIYFVKQGADGDVRVENYVEPEKEEVKPVTEIKPSEMSVKVPDHGQAELKMSRGGVRPGAGRKKTGFENRKASISLPPDRWELLDKIQQHESKTKSDVLAELIQIGIETKLLELMGNDGTIKWKGEEA